MRLCIFVYTKINQNKKLIVFKGKISRAIHFCFMKHQLKVVLVVIFYHGNTLATLQLYNLFNGPFWAFMAMD